MRKLTAEYVTKKLFKTKIIKKRERERVLNLHFTFHFHTHETGKGASG